MAALTDLTVEVETRLVWIDTLDEVLAGDHASRLGAPVRLSDLNITDHFDGDRITTLRAFVSADGAIHQPLIIHCHPDGTMTLRDGHHRYIVARDLGIAIIPAQFHIGYYTADGTVEYPSDPQW